MRYWQKIISEKENFSVLRKKRFCPVFLSDKVFCTVKFMVINIIIVIIIILLFINNIYIYIYIIFFGILWWWYMYVLWMNKNHFIVIILCLSVFTDINMLLYDYTNIGIVKLFSLIMYIFIVFTVNSPISGQIYIPRDLVKVL